MSEHPHEGGSYTLDPKTGKRTRVAWTAASAAASADAPGAASAAAPVSPDRKTAAAKDGDSK